MQCGIDRGTHASVLKSIRLIGMYAFSNWCVNICIHLHESSINVLLSLSCTVPLDVPVMIIMPVTVRMMIMMMIIVIMIKMIVTVKMITV